MWRTSPEFSQRYEARIDQEGRNGPRCMEEVIRWWNHMGARLQRRLHPPDELSPTSLFATIGTAEPDSKPVRP